jgi:hypothetical protein
MSTANKVGAGYGFLNSYSKKVNEERAVSQTIRGVVAGDALVCLAKAIAAFGRPFKEVATITKLNGQEYETPFMHHISSEGVDVPYGTYHVEGLGLIKCEVSLPELYITVLFEKDADEVQLDTLIKLLSAELESHKSLFKNRAIKVSSELDLLVPDYISTEKDIPLFLIPAAAQMVEDNIYYPILHSLKLAEAGITGQRGILLHGKYGTGKSLIAYKTASMSVSVGRTFVLCSNDMTGAAIKLGQFMAPSTLFLEDFVLNQMSGFDRSALRNTLSGVEAKKGHDVIMIMTTNFLGEVIENDRALLRPDRIDAIIEIPPPDLATTIELVSHYMGDWLEAGGDWDVVYARMVELQCTPAILVEVTKRSKITSIRTGQKITSDVVLGHLENMQQQIDLSQPEPPVIGTNATRLAESLYAVVRAND